jgi:hypothetical protein
MHTVGAKIFLASEGRELLCSLPGVNKMKMPGFTAEAALYQRVHQGYVATSNNTVGRSSVRMSSFLLDFDPSVLHVNPIFESPRWNAKCGPCECHWFASGMFLEFTCWKECWTNWFVPGGEDISTRSYQPCWPWE